MFAYKGFGAWHVGLAPSWIDCIFADYSWNRIWPFPCSTLGNLHSFKPATGLRRRESQAAHTMQPVLIALCAFFDGSLLSPITMLMFIVEFGVFFPPGFFHSAGGTPKRLSPEMSGSFNTDFSGMKTRLKLGSSFPTWLSRVTSIVSKAGMFYSS